MRLETIWTDLSLSQIDLLLHQSIWDNEPHHYKDHGVHFFKEANCQNKHMDSRYWLLLNLSSNYIMMGKLIHL